MGALDQVQIIFDEGKLFLLNIALAVIMFGVALSLRTKDFTSILDHPRGVLTGIFSQFILLPALTGVLIWIIAPIPSLALGMVLVAACPGGNVSNFFSFIGKGNVALSVSLTIIASLASVFVTPYNFLLWSSLVIDSSAVKLFSIDAMSIGKTIFMILIVPLFLGVLAAEKLPTIVNMIKNPLKYVSFVLLVVIISVAFSNNIEIFKQYYHYVIYLVLAHNGLALLGGYALGKVSGNTRKDIVSITIETGIQNSGLGLVIIFTFFDGNGGMAIITAWWGIWHIISGFLIAQVFSYQAKRLQTTTK